MKFYVLLYVINISVCHVLFKDIVLNRLKYISFNHF